MCAREGQAVVLLHMLELEGTELVHTLEYLWHFGVYRVNSFELTPLVMSDERSERIEGKIS